MSANETMEQIALDIRRLQMRCTKLEITAELHKERLLKLEFPFRSIPVGSTEIVQELNAIVREARELLASGASRSYPEEILRHLVAWADRP